MKPTAADLAWFLSPTGLGELLDLGAGLRRQAADEYAEFLTEHLTRTTADRRAVELGFYVDLDRALVFSDFCSSFIRHSKGRWAGQRFHLLGWQWADIALPLFGWVHRETGLRRFRQCYLEVPKKNGKTSLAAACALFLLIGDGEPGAEVYIAAYSKDQAKIAYRDVEHAVRKSPELRHLRPYRANSRIVDESTASFLQAISSDFGGQEGLNVHGLVFDELHAQKNRDLWNVLEGGGAARTQPMTIGITTAGDERSKLCRELHDYALSIAAGDNDDPTFLGKIYAADLEDDWDDEKTWRKANPSLGETVTVDFLEGLAAKARVSRPARENFFRRHLNIWTRGACRWIAQNRWDACEDAAYLDEHDGRKPGPAGLDLASSIDLVSLVRVFDLPDGRIGVRCKCWTTDYAREVREAEQNRHRYGAWIDAGFLDVAGAEVVDHDIVRQTVIDDADAGLISEVGIDPWGNGIYLAAKLNEDHGIETSLVRQGYQTMSPPTKQLEELIISRQLVHDGHPVLRWAIGNVVVASDPAGNLKPDRRRSPEKIDPAVALVIALARYLADDQQGPSVYEERGILIL